MSKWLEMFNANYNEETPQAKELKNYVKENYKGNIYVPWAVMQRMVYQQDPEAEFMEPKLESMKHTLRTNTGETETSVDFFVHMITAGITFLGKTVVETYPVQDNAYDAPKVIDANMTNKAMQRAKAKVASIATGLALKLYEGKDLQFEDDKKEEKKAPKKTKAVEIEKVEEPKVASSEVLTIAEELVSDENHNKGLQKINPSLLKKYGFTISTTEAPEEVAAKLEQLDNPMKFLEMVKKNSGM